MARLITFEGIEGSGKTTQIRRLEQNLVERGYQVIVTREPGGCRIADEVRRILLDSANTALTPTAELLLYAAARAQHVEEVIRPALAQDKIVLCDRYIDATVAYQGHGRGLDLLLITELNKLATHGLTPHLTLFLDLAVEQGVLRARTRNTASAIDEGRFEAEALEFHTRVRSGYQLLARKEPRFVVIDASGSIEAIAARVVTAVNATLG